MTPRTGPHEEFVLSTVAIRYGIRAVLLQKDEHGDLRPVSYFAKFLNNARRRYPVYDQELLAMVCAVKDYRHYIEGYKHLTILTHHATLRHLPTRESMGRLHTIFMQLLVLISHIA